MTYSSARRLAPRDALHRKNEGEALTGIADPDSLELLVRDLAAADPAPLVNPYACFDPALDQSGGPERRCENLLTYVQARPRPALLLVGEAAGYQGCRFSGIAFTSERCLPPSPWTSRRPDGWREPSATIVHAALADLSIEERTILWNVVPFHPTDGGPLSNRRPTAAERRDGAVYLERLVEISQPRLVAAIGRIAERALPPGTTYLCHPSRGGAPRFRSDLAALVRTQDIA